MSYAIFRADHSRCWHRIATLPALMVLAAAMCLPLANGQQTGGAYELTKSTIDSGGGRSQGGAFAVTGTIAQPDASTQTARGGAFAVSGGFWANTAAVDEVMFTDGFEGPRT